MLAKIPKKREDNRSSFRQLIRYVTRCEEHIAIEPDDRGQLLAQPGIAIRSNGNVTCMTNCMSLDSAELEMLAVARQNPRVPDPVYHLILSWPPDEHPEDEKIFQCAKDVMERMGMSGHQYVFAIHRDTDSSHIHMAINLVHPETFKAANRYYDFFRLDRIMREMELKYGWKHSDGPYEVKYVDDEAFVVRAERGQDKSVKQPSKAREYEVHTGEQSFISYVRGEPRNDVLRFLRGKKQKNWQELHHVLARYGLGIRPKGRGFVVYHLNETTLAVKASDMLEALGKGRVEKVLGNYMAASASQNQNQGYQRKPQPMRNATEREKRKLQRGAARKQLRERYYKLKREFKPKKLDATEVRNKFAAIREHAAAQRKSVLSTVPDANVRKALYGVIAFIASREENNLRLSLRTEREKLRYDPANRFPEFRVWVAQEAANGDTAAVSQMRGWRYSEKRREVEAIRPK